MEVDKWNFSSVWKFLDFKCRYQRSSSKLECNTRSTNTKFEYFCLPVAEDDIFWAISDAHKSMIQVCRTSGIVINSGSVLKEVVLGLKLKQSLPQNAIISMIIFPSHDLQWILNCENNSEFFGEVYWCNTSCLCR